MTRAPSADCSVLPGMAVLFFCAAVLFAGHIAAATRPFAGSAGAAEGATAER
jgi:hypothetical protein